MFFYAGFVSTVLYFEQSILSIIYCSFFKNMFCVRLSWEIWLYFAILLRIFVTGGVSDKCNVYNISMGSLQKEIQHKCFLVAIPPVLSNLMSTLHNLSCIFSSEQAVAVAVLGSEKGGIRDASSEIKWHDGKDDADEDLAFFNRQIEDMTCLLPMPVQKIKSKCVDVARTVEDLVRFLNENCDTFIDVKNGKTMAGYRRDSILDNLYHAQGVRAETEHLEAKKDRNHKMPVVAKCDRIHNPTREEFISNYLFKSKPVIIQDGVKHWPAISKWTNSYLREIYGEKETHVKLTPNGEYEGCDFSEKFDNFKSFKIPDIVKSKLAYPELVVVRPATMNMNFSKFLDIIEKHGNISAYLEYSSIPGNFKILENDLEEPEILKNVLHLHDLNIWLSNGNTLGKLHFDPYDNLLCQLRGAKEAILFEPHNNDNLYEAHIQEAKLGYDEETNSFRHHKLVDSTSMVMSPINILKPDYVKFPKYANTRPLNCTIKEGDILYIPAFWWHEVQSYPNAAEKRNLAVNYWYKPFLTKSFPCPACDLDTNSIYRHLLDQYEV